MLVFWSESVRAYSHREMRVIAFVKFRVRYRRQRAGRRAGCAPTRSDVSSRHITIHITRTSSGRGSKSTNWSSSEYTELVDVDGIPFRSAPEPSLAATAAGTAGGRLGLRGGTTGGPELFVAATGTGGVGNGGDSSLSSPAAAMSGSKLPALSLCTCPAPTLLELVAWLWLGPMGGGGLLVRAGM